MRDLPPRPLRRRACCSAALIALALCPACSTLSPQVFSEQLVPAEPQPEAAPAGDVPIDRAIREAEALERRYVKSVKELSELGTGSSAALIVLSALGLYKGVTNPNGRDLAGIGIVGAGTYAYASTMGSRPRQQLFLAGAEVLNCAVAATRPYQLPPEWLFPPGGDRPDESLPTLGAAAQRQAVELSAHVDLLSPYQQRWRVRELVGAAAPADCREQIRRGCGKASPDPDRQRRREACLAAAAAERARCAGPSSREIDVPPDPELDGLVKQLVDQGRRLRQLAASARQQSVLIGQAGNALAQVTVETQFRVAREALKTEPDIAAVLAAAQAMRGTALALSSSAALRGAPAAADDAASAAGKAESGGRRAKSATVPTVHRQVPRDTIDAARKALRAARDAEIPLQARLDTIDRRLRLTRVPLDRCGQALGGGLTVTPDVASLDVAPGGRASFLVAGGSGTPQGTLQAADNPRPGQLSRNLDGSFVYQADAGAAAGSAVTLRFTDGSGRLVREVVVQVTGGSSAAMPGSVDIRRIDEATLRKALGLAAAPLNDKEVQKAVETCLKEKLNVAQPDIEHVGIRELADILAGRCRG